MIVSFFIGGILLLEHCRNCKFGNCRGDTDGVLSLAFTLSLSGIYMNYDGENAVLKGCALYIPRNLRKKRSLQIFIVSYFTRFGESKKQILFFNSE